MGARLLGLLLAAGTAAALGCALGPEEEPGCHHDTECGEGWVCRAGACFRTTTGQTSPAVTDAGDAGEPGDAGEG